MLKQHLIDPEICIRCNTCEDTCPIKAISHDSRNYVVDASICKACMACIAPCPTGAIDNWRLLPPERVELHLAQLVQRGFAHAAVFEHVRTCMAHPPSAWAQAQDGAGVIGAVGRRGLGGRLRGGLHVVVPGALDDDHNVGVLRGLRLRAGLRAISGG